MRLSISNLTSHEDIVKITENDKLDGIINQYLS